jgi:hypothetical protein
MKKNLLLVLLVSSLVLLSSQSGFSQVQEEYSLVPVDLEIGSGDSTVEVDIHIVMTNRIKSFFVPLFAEGTSNPILDTILTGGLQDTNPPAFAPPSLVKGMQTKVVDPYGPPTDPLFFMAKDSVHYVGPTTSPERLYCRMFYKVSGPGTLTFRTAIHSTLGAVHMIRYDDGDTLQLNWPAEGEVGSYNIVPYTNKFLLQPVDYFIAPGDSLVQFNLNIALRDTIASFVLPFYAEGSSNPVLDTFLTGGLADSNPPGFASPSLVSGFPTKYINPYGPPADPLLFKAIDFANPIRSDNGLFCRMFYKLSNSGTLIFRTAGSSSGDSVNMFGPDSTPTPVNWPKAGVVGNFQIRGTFTPENEYSLDPIDLVISPCDSIVQVNIKIKTVQTIVAFVVPLLAEGTSNPVLDTILTGGLCSANPQGFVAPSLVAYFTQRIVMPYGPPLEPMLFVAVDFGGGLPPSNGLFCRMFYKVSGPGSLTFRTAVHPTGGQVCMYTPYEQIAVTWPAAGEVDSFEVTAGTRRGDANYDCKLTVADIVYLVSYLFKGGPPPFVSQAGDFNCDGQITVADVIYLLNYLFKGGPPAPC